MKLRTSLAAAGVAAALAVTGALVLPAVASAHSSSTTLKLTAETNKQVPFTKTSAGLQETDVNSAGKTIGFDVVNVTFKGNSGTAGVTFDIKGGFLYVTVTTTNNGKTFAGKVTGGTGSFAGATGTVKAKAISSSKTAVTITYSG